MSRGPDAREAAGRFEFGGPVLDVAAYGNGNVNDTFLATSGAGVPKRFILQRINTRVFRRPELIMRNLRVLADHVRKRTGVSPFGEVRRWELPLVVPAKDGKDYWTGTDGSFWRALSFIEGSRSYETVRDLDHAKEVGFALGLFHRLISDLPAKELSDTLEGFHVTPLYLRHFDEVLAQTRPARSPEIDYALDFIGQRRALAGILEQAKASGRLFDRPIHGDPKVNNVMIDTQTGRAVSMIDLDTVKPGLVHYDIGDCLRSCCNPLGETAEQIEAVRFDTGVCKAVLSGYFSMAAGFLTENDYEHFYDAIRLIPFELGLRFFTDYLEGDGYFKTRYKEHNLDRALVQFKLTESIESRAAEIRTIIADLSPALPG